MLEFIAFVVLSSESVSLAELFPGTQFWNAKVLAMHLLVGGNNVYGIVLRYKLRRNLVSKSGIEVFLYRSTKSRIRSSSWETSMFRGNFTVSNKPMRHVGNISGCSVGYHIHFSVGLIWWRYEEPKTIWTG